MNYNTFLYLFGFNSDDFKDTLVDPIKEDEKTYSLYVEQRTDTNRICPFCNSNKVIIKDFDFVSYNIIHGKGEKCKITIKKVRFKCKSCNKTYTPEIQNITRRNEILDSTKQSIVRNFVDKISFSDIAKNYFVSVTTVINIFDKAYSFVPRNEMPSILCIDEFYFSKEYDQNYCCVISDMKKKKIVDVLKNRRKEYLNEYFSNISVREREKVKYFVSDLYDEYRIVRKKFFKNATHIADRFHVVLQLTRAISKRRVKVMNSVKNTNKILYNFMKSHWEYFERSKFAIPNKEYKNKSTGIIYSYQNLFDKCLKLDHDLNSAYDVLQQIISRKFNYSENAETFMLNIADILDKCFDIDIKKVASTYRKWINEISNAYAAYAIENHISNSLAEQINNNISTIIKVSCGLNNFERLRKRALIISNNKGR